MNVLRTIPFYRPAVNGPINQADQISQKLAVHDIHSHIYTTDNMAQDEPALEKHDNITIHRLKEKGGFLAYRRTIGIDQIDQESPDLIHAHLYRNLLTSKAANLAIRKEKPYILQPHGTFLMYKKVVANPLIHIPYQCYDLIRKNKEVMQADAIIVATRQEMEEAIHYGVQEDKLHLIPVGCRKIDISEKCLPDTHGRKLKLLFVGRIGPNRNVEQIIQSIANLRQAEQDAIEVEIVGPVGLTSLIHNGEKYLQSLKDMASSLKLDHIIQFSGPAYGDELSNKYLHADLFMYTSLYESFGQTILEAASHGCPIISTETGIARDLVKDNETGYYVTAHDSGSMAEKLTELINDRNRLSQLARAMHALIANEYDWDHIMNQYLEIYHSFK